MQSYAPLCKPAKIQTPTLEYERQRSCNSCKRVLINLRKSRMGPIPCHEEAPDGRVSLAVLHRFFTHAVTSSHHILQLDVFASLCMFKDAKFPVVSSTPSCRKKKKYCVTWCTWSYKVSVRVFFYCTYLYYDKLSFLFSPIISLLIQLRKKMYFL